MSKASVGIVQGIGTVLLAAWPIGCAGAGDPDLTEFDTLESSITLLSGETFLRSMDANGDGVLESVYKRTIQAGLDKLRIVYTTGRIEEHSIVYNQSWAVMDVQDLDGVPGEEMVLSVRYTADNLFKVQTIGLGSDWEYDPNPPGARASWALMGVADTDGKPGKELILNVLISNSKTFRFIHMRGAPVERQFSIPSHESVIMLNGGIVDVDGVGGAELIINRRGTEVYVIRDADFTTQSYEIGTGQWSILGYSELNGVPGNEIVIKDANRLQVISDAKKNLRSFSLDAGWTFQRFENTDGNPGNEVVGLVNGVQQSVVYGNEAPPVTSLGAPLIHRSSGLCIHPSGGSANPGNGTPAVLHTGCDPEPRLNLLFTSQGSIRQSSSGKCLHPEGGSAAPADGTRLVYWSSCNDSRLAFMMVPDGSIRHQPSGKCVATLGSPVNGTELRLQSCNGAAEQRFSVAALTPDVRLRHSGGLCVRPQGGASAPASGTSAELWNDCRALASEHHFQLLMNGSLQHVASGMCLHPQGGSMTPGNQTPVVFWHTCGSENIRFEVTPGGSIRHAASGKCIHPYMGSPAPAVGTGLVLYDGCDEARLRFTLERKREIIF